MQVEVFNIMGQSVATVADRSYSAGTHSFTFDGSDHSSGVYFVNVKYLNQSKIQRVMLLK